MGIYDRGYYRDEPSRGGGGGLTGRYRWRGFSAWSVTTWLIVINVAVFVVDTFLVRHGVPVYMQTIQRVENFPPPSELTVGPGYYQFDQLGRPVETGVGPVGSAVYQPLTSKKTGDVVGWQQDRVMYPLEALGHFSTFEGFQRLEVWRLVTYQFLHSHGTIWHIGLNMFALWMFGTLVEEQLGRRKYLALYLVSGIFGGLMYLLLNLLGSVFQVTLPGVLFSSTTTPLVGASACVFGVIMACAYIAPNLPVYIMFIPIPLRMKWVAYGWLALAAFNLLAAGHNAGGDAAHVGGALAGAFFARNSHLLLDFFDVFGDSRLGKGKGARGAGRARPSAAEASAAREEAKIDTILAKVNQHGIGSLSEKEKKLLARDTERRRRGGS